MSGGLFFCGASYPPAPSPDTSPVPGRTFGVAAASRDITPAYPHTDCAPGRMQKRNLRRGACAAVPFFLSLRLITQ